MGRNYPRHPGEREAYLERAPERVTVRMVDPANEQITKIVEKAAAKPKRERKKSKKKPKAAVDGSGPTEPKVVETPAEGSAFPGAQDDLFNVTEKKDG